MAAVSAPSIGRAPPPSCGSSGVDLVHGRSSGRRGCPAENDWGRQATIQPIQHPRAQESTAGAADAHTSLDVIGRIDRWPRPGTDIVRHRTAQALRTAHPRAAHPYSGDTGQENHIAPQGGIHHKDPREEEDITTRDAIHRY